MENTRTPSRREFAARLGLGIAGGAGAAVVAHAATAATETSDVTRRLHDAIEQLDAPRRQALLTLAEISLGRGA